MRNIDGGGTGRSCVWPSLTFCVDCFFRCPVHTPPPLAPLTKLQSTQSGSSRNSDPFCLLLLNHYHPTSLSLALLKTTMSPLPFKYVRNSYSYNRINTCARLESIQREYIKSLDEYKKVMLYAYAYAYPTEVMHMCIYYCCLT